MGYVTFNPALWSTADQLKKWSIPQLKVYALKLHDALTPYLKNVAADTELCSKEFAGNPIDSTLR